MGLMIYDGNLFLIESKAGSYTFSARRASKDRMLKDLKKLVADAHEHALRAKNYIDTNENPIFTFIDKYNQKIVIDKNKIRRIFLLVVTLDQLDAFITTLIRTSELGLFSEEELPWAVSVFDLRVICELAGFPAQIIHYLLRRLRLNQRPHPKGWGMRHAACPFLRIQKSSSLHCPDMSGLCS